MKNNPGPPLILTVPTGSPTKGQLLPASAIAGLVVGPLSTIYIQPKPSDGGRGDDATAQRGNAALPCATWDKAIALAVAALPAVSTYELSPGKYAPPSAKIPASLVNGAINVSAGLSGGGITVIDGTGLGIPCIDLSGGSRELWIIGPGVQLESDPGVPSVKADGSSAAPGTYFTSGALVISGVLTGGGSVFAAYVGLMIMEELEAIGSDKWTLAHVGQTFAGPGFFSPDLSIEYWYDGADPKAPPVDQSRLFMFGGATWLDGFLTLGNQAGVVCETGSALPNITSDNNHPFNIFGPPGLEKFPTVQLAGGSSALEVKANGGISPEFPDTSVALGIDFSGATLKNGFRISTGPGPGLLNRQALKAIGTIVVNASGLNPTDAGPGFDLDFTNGSIPNVIASLRTLGVGGDQATVIPPNFATAPQAAVAGGNTVNFPFNLPGGNYSAIIDSDDPTALPLAVDGRGGSGCVAHVVNGAGNIRVFVSSVLGP